MKKVITFLVLLFLIGSMFAQAPVKRNPSNNASASHTNVVTPPKQNVTNKPSPLNGYHEKNYSDGRVYKGNFKNDLFDGYGELLWPDGSYYKGNFKEGKQHGSGTFVVSDYKFGDISFHKAEISGSYENGLLYGGNCKMTLEFNDGNRIEGVFDDMSKGTGRGTFTWTNGSKYEGDFVGLIPTGKGSLTWPDGSKYVGDFIDNKRTGQGVYTTIDGYRYEGQFVDGLYQGKGVETWKQDATKPNNSCRVECMYEKGKRHGSGTAYYNDYTYKKGIWENGTMVKVTENGTWHW